MMESTEVDQEAESRYNFETNKVNETGRAGAAFDEILGFGKETPLLSLPIVKEINAVEGEVSNTDSEEMTNDAAMNEYASTTESVVTTEFIAQLTTAFATALSPKLLVQLESTSAESNKITDEAGADQVATDQVAADQATADQTAADTTGLDEAVATQAAAGQARTDMATADVAASDHTAADQVQADHAAAYQAAEDPGVADHATAHQAPADQAPADQTLADQAPADQAVADPAAADQAASDQVAADQVAADQAAADQAAVAADEAAADQTAASQAAADQAAVAADQAAADQAAADQAAADQAAADQAAADQAAADQAKIDDNSAVENDKHFFLSSHCHADPCGTLCCATIARSTLYSKCCNFPSKKLWPLLITGTPRSGTVFSHRLMRNLGLDMHDDWGMPRRDGIVSWIHVFSELDDRAHPKSRKFSPYFGPAKSLAEGRFKVVAHQVRDPLSSLTSMCAEPGGGYQKNLVAWDYINKHVPVTIGSIRSNARSVRIRMQFFLNWHRFIDSLDAWRFKLEDISNPSSSPAIIQQLFQRLGRPIPSAKSVFTALRRVPHDTNTRKHRKGLTWEDLFCSDADLARSIWDLWKAYGYTWDYDITRSEKLECNRVPSCL